MLSHSQCGFYIVGGLKYQLLLNINTEAISISDFTKFDIRWTLPTETSIPTFWDSSSIYPLRSVSQS